MIQTDLQFVPTYYQAYIDELPRLSLDAVLHFSLEQLSQKTSEQLAAIGNEVYAPGKWRVPVILQHLIDTERVMAYRALRFARKDATPLPGFDQDAYAAVTIDAQRPVSELMDELKLVRLGSIYLFDSLDEEAVAQAGMANGQMISVAALAYIIAGHQAHHLRIVQERYRPLAKTPVSPF